MKKIVAVFVVVMLAFMATAYGGMNYVIVDGKTYFSEEVKVGISSVKVVTDEGLILKAPLKRVDAYMVDGKVFERLPLVCCNGKVKCTALLELVAHRNGLRLYKYHSSDTTLGCPLGDKQNEESIFLVYKEGKLHLRVNEENGVTVLAFFNVPCNLDI